MPSSTVENPAIEWPPPRTASGRPSLRARSTVRITSATPARERSPPDAGRARRSRCCGPGRSPRRPAGLRMPRRPAANSAMVASPMRLGPVSVIVMRFLQVALSCSRTNARQTDLNENSTRSQRAGRGSEPVCVRVPQCGQSATGDDAVAPSRESLLPWSVSRAARCGSASSTGQLGRSSAATSRPVAAREPAVPPPVRTSPAPPVVSPESSSTAPRMVNVAPMPTWSPADSKPASERRALARPRSTSPDIASSRAMLISVNSSPRRSPRSTRSSRARERDSPAAW